MEVFRCCRCCSAGILLNSYAYKETQAVPSLDVSWHSLWACNQGTEPVIRHGCPARSPVVSRPLDTRPASAWTLRERRFGPGWKCWMCWVLKIDEDHSRRTFRRCWLLWLLHHQCSRDYCAIQPNLSGYSGIDPQLEKPPTRSTSSSNGPMAALPDAHQVERTGQQTGESAQNHASTELAPKPGLVFASCADRPGYLMLPAYFAKGLLRSGRTLTGRVWKCDHVWYTPKWSFWQGK